MWLKIETCSGGIGSIVGKGENAGYQHFLLFPKCFSIASFPKFFKSQDCVVKGLMTLLSQESKPKCFEKYLPISDCEDLRSDCTAFVIWSLSTPSEKNQ